MKVKNTDNLKMELMTAPCLTSFLKENDDSFQKPDIQGLILNMIHSHDISKSVLARQAGMSEVYLHQLLSGRRNPSRSRVLCICIGMGASLDETQELLKKGGFAQLYARNRRDAVIMHGITHQKTLTQINESLYLVEEETLV